MSNKWFEFKEDLKYFQKIFPKEIMENEEVFMSFFDFRDPKTNWIKRKEFNKIKKQVKEDLIKKHGEVCQLWYNNMNCRCDLDSGFVVDHFIPVSSNKLNKELVRRQKTTKDKNGKTVKVKTQSLWSNHPNNLIIACNVCNNHKKHRIPTKELIEKIMKIKWLI